MKRQVADENNDHQKSDRLKRGRFFDRRRVLFHVGTTPLIPRYSRSTSLKESKILLFDGNLGKVFRLQRLEQLFRFSVFLYGFFDFRVDIGG